MMKRKTNYNQRPWLVSIVDGEAVRKRMEDALS